MRFQEFAEVLDGQGETPCMAYPDAFFRDRDQDERQKYVIARQLCQSCPIRLQCLEYAVTNGEDYGIWGGMTPREREGLRRGYAA